MCARLFSDVRAALALPGPLWPRLVSAAGVALPLPLVFGAARLARCASVRWRWLRRFRLAWLFRAGRFCGRVGRRVARSRFGVWLFGQGAFAPGWFGWLLADLAWWVAVLAALALVLWLGCAPGSFGPSAAPGAGAPL
jgi:hypothetical protein